MPPCGGHPFWAKGWPGRRPFQVVPPCGGHPDGFDEKKNGLPVSSRAPVWGASLPKSSSVFGGGTVSSRAPVWGASNSWMLWSSKSIGFKSCPRVGGIRGMITVSPAMAMFQVVPPCGGHRVETGKGAGERSFKSCPRVGGITSWYPFVFMIMRFQVVPPCGGHQAKLWNTTKS